MNRRVANQLRGKIRAYAGEKAYARSAVVTVEVNPHGTSQYCSRAAARGRGSPPRKASVSTSNGENCSGARIATMKQMPTSMPRQICITAFITRCIGNGATRGAEIPPHLAKGQVGVACQRDAPAKTGRPGRFLREHAMRYGYR